VKYVLDKFVVCILNYCLGNKFKNFVLVNHENETTIYFADGLVLINKLTEFILVEL